MGSIWEHFGELGDCGVAVAGFGVLAAVLLRTFYPQLTPTHTQKLELSLTGDSLGVCVFGCGWGCPQLLGGVAVCGRQLMSNENHGFHTHTRSLI